MSTGVRALFAKLDDEIPITYAAAAAIVGVSDSRFRRLVRLLLATGDIAIDEYDLIRTTQPTRRQPPLLPEPEAAV